MNLRTFTFYFFYLFLLSSTHAQDRLLWTLFGFGEMQSSLLDGTDQAPFIEYTGGGGNISLDYTNQHIYWSVASGYILRTDFSGSTLDTIISGLDNVEGVAVDPIHEKIYWSDAGEDWIQRSDLDGANVETLYAWISLNPGGLCLDSAGQFLYYSARGDGIGRINTTTLQNDTLVALSGFTLELEIDEIHEKLYWTQVQDEGKIYRCNLDGTGLEEVIPGLGRPHGLALDITAGKMYWTDWGGSLPKFLKKANLDGTGIENVLSFESRSVLALEIWRNPVVSNTSDARPEESVVIYPNPVTSNFTLQIPEGSVTDLHIYNNLGVRCKSASVVTDTESIDISALLPGHYFITFRHSGNFTVKSILKM